MFEEQYLSIEAINTILGVKKDVEIDPIRMVKKLKFCIFPNSKNYVLDPVIVKYQTKLLETFKNLGVEVIPYSYATRRLTLPEIVKYIKNIFLLNLYEIKHGSFNFFTLKFGKKIKEGVSVIAFGNDELEQLPIDNVVDIKNTQIIAVIKSNKSDEAASTFDSHLQLSTSLFAWNMANLIVHVHNNEKWTLYSYNASHPTFKFDSSFEKTILSTLISKVYAPVIPPKMSDFVVVQDTVDSHQSSLDDLIQGSRNFDQTGLFPSGRKISDLKFRSNFYRWLGSLLLDKRNGMSYGYLAHQLPYKTKGARKFVDELDTPRFKGKDFYVDGKDRIFVLLSGENEKLVVEVPDVLVYTSRSGSNKTNLDVSKDVILMGLSGGQKYLYTINGQSFNLDYKPSFDTLVIFAHAVMNALMAEVFNYYQICQEYVDRLGKEGRGLAHWHGYLNPSYIPKSVYCYGSENPPVSCSAPQTGIYAIRGKEMILREIIRNKLDYAGDVHIEPQHGINFSYWSLRLLAEFVIKNPESTKLGNEYYEKYF